MHSTHKIFAKHQGGEGMAGGHATNVLTKKLADIGVYIRVSSKTNFVRMKVSSARPRELVGAHTAPGGRFRL